MDESLVLFSLCYKVFYLLPKQPGGDGRESSSFLTVIKCFIYFLPKQPGGDGASLVVMDESLVLFSLCYKVF